MADLLAMRILLCLFILVGLWPKTKGKLDKSERANALTNKGEYVMASARLCHRVSCERANLVPNFGAMSALMLTISGHYAGRMIDSRRSA